jgi:hypothetical protein
MTGAVNPETIIVYPVENDQDVGIGFRMLLAASLRSV